MSSADRRALRQLLTDLPDADLPLPGHILADIHGNIDDSDGQAMLMIEALTVVADQF